MNLVKLILFMANGTMPGQQTILYLINPWVLLQLLCQRSKFISTGNIIAPIGYLRITQALKHRQRPTRNGR